MKNLPSWPHDADGNPMDIVIGHITDVVKTAEFCSVHMGHTIMRPIPQGSAEERINAARQTQREAEYVVGVERYLLNCELKGTVIPINPETGDRFAGTPNGYNPESMKPHPADVVADPGGSGS